MSGRIPGWRRESQDERIDRITQAICADELELGVTLDPAVVRIEVVEALTTPIDPATPFGLDLKFVERGRSKDNRLRVVAWRRARALERWDPKDDNDALSPSEKRARDSRRPKEET